MDLAGVSVIPASLGALICGLPQYLDNKESDVFILSGAEDLVPVANPDGSRFEEQRDGFRITRYPATESKVFLHASNAGPIWATPQIASGARFLATTLPPSTARLGDQHCGPGGFFLHLYVACLRVIRRQG